jgi:SAM-dependent methyltransferase
MTWKSGIQESIMNPDMQALKNRLKAVWMSGDYGLFAKYMEADALEFLARLKLTPQTRLLDVACGAGQIAIPAARAGVQVTGVDIATNLIMQARQRAAAENLAVQFDEGDAEMLPYADGSFDIVTSLVGAMFAPRPDRVAAELLRVCRPGGRIVMANWTPTGFVGQLFKTIGRHVPPPVLMPSPLLWGDEATVRDRFHLGVSDLRIERRMYLFDYPFGPADVVEFYRTYYGPMNRAFASLDEAGQTALGHELTQLWSAHNTGDATRTTYLSEYLEISAIRA